jgi:methylglyoxal reductase
VLTGKYGPESTVNMGLAKQKVEWYRKENLAKIVELKSKWEPLFKKYDCTMGQLVLAWTMAQGTGDNVSVLGGARTIPQIEENSDSGNITIDAADLASMRKDVEMIS